MSNTIGSFCVLLVGPSVVDRVSVTPAGPPVMECGRVLGLYTAYAHSPHPGDQNLECPTGAGALTQGEDKCHNAIKNIIS